MYSRRKFKEIIVSRELGWNIQVSNEDEISSYRLNQIQEMEIKCWAKKGQDFSTAGITDIMLGHLFFEPVKLDMENKVLVLTASDEW